MPRVKAEPRRPRAPAVAQFAHDVEKAHFRLGDTSIDENGKELPTVHPWHEYRLLVAPVDERGCGVFNVGDPIPEGVNLGPYVGLVFRGRRSNGSDYRILVTTGTDDYTIDATCYGNWARFVNGCEPDRANCALRQQRLFLQVDVVTIAPIPFASQLRFFYGEHFTVPSRSFPEKTLRLEYQTAHDARMSDGVTGIG